LLPLVQAVEKFGREGAEISAGELGLTFRELRYDLVAFDFGGLIAGRRVQLRARGKKVTGKMAAELAFAMESLPVIRLFPTAERFRIGGQSGIDAEVAHQAIYRRRAM